MGSAWTKWLHRVYLIIKFQYAQNTNGKISSLFGNVKARGRKQEYIVIFYTHDIKNEAKSVRERFFMRLEMPNSLKQKAKLVNV